MAAEITYERVEGFTGAHLRTSGVRANLSATLDRSTENRFYVQTGPRKGAPADQVFAEVDLREAAAFLIELANELARRGRA